MFVIDPSWIWFKSWRCISALYSSNGALAGYKTLKHDQMFGKTFLSLSQLSVYSASHNVVCSVFITVASMVAEQSDTWSVFRNSSFLKCNCRQFELVDPDPTLKTFDSVLSSTNVFAGGSCLLYLCFYIPVGNRTHETSIMQCSQANEVLKDMALCNFHHIHCWRTANTVQICITQRQSGIFSRENIAKELWCRCKRHQATVMAYFTYVRFLCAQKSYARTTSHWLTRIAFLPVCPSVYCWLCHECEFSI